MMIEIDDDTIDEMIGQAMIENYIAISNSLKNKEFPHSDDVAAFEELLPALKIVGNWYCFDFEKKLKKAKK